MNAALLQISQRIDGLPTTTTVASGAQVLGGGSGFGGSLDLRPLNNTWTANNVWTGGEAVGVNRNRFLGLTSGAITAFVSDTIMLESIANNVVQYQALVDVQKTSEASVFNGMVGGNAAIYVQHRNGGTATKAHAAYGIRCQMQSYAITAIGTANAVAAGYFSVLNQTTNGIGHGMKVEAWHKGTNQTATYGFEANMLRYFQDGQTIGFHARAASSGLYSKDSDYAFLASGNGPRFKTAFAGGSTFLGRLNCDVGLDLSYASCNLAAISIPPDRKIYLNGPENTAGLHFNSGGAFQFTVNSAPIFSFGSDGSLFLHYPQTVGPDPGDPPSVQGYLVVNMGGFPRRIQFK